VDGMSDNDLADVLERYALRAVAPAVRLARGTSNENYLVQTQLGPKVLRRIRVDQPDERVRGEHETIAWVHERGLPVTVPMTPSFPSDEPGGLPDTCVRLQGRGDADFTLWALFDFIDGDVPPCGRLSASQADALGDIHGRLHDTLAEHPRSAGASFSMEWSFEHSDRLLQLSLGAARKASAPTTVLEAMELQRSLLAAATTGQLRAPAVPVAARRLSQRTGSATSLPRPLSAHCVTPAPFRNSLTALMN
jgi:Ser/Thr protein kinase RdoA (MazF antagonist)